MGFSYTFVQETKFLDFYEGVCHNVVTEAKHWACWYLFWYHCLEETFKSDYWYQNKHIRGLILKI